MARFQAPLKKREEICTGTWAFTFDVGGHSFSFVPGQAVDVFLVNPPHPDPRGNQHPFTIAGTTGPETITIATRIRQSVWKKNLLEMPLGAKVEIDGPWGDFVLPREPGQQASSPIPDSPAFSVRRSAPPGSEVLLEQLAARPGDDHRRHQEPALAHDGRRGLEARLHVGHAPRHQE